MGRPLPNGTRETEKAKPWNSCVGGIPEMTNARPYNHLWAIHSPEKASLPVASGLKHLMDKEARAQELPGTAHHVGTRRESCG